MAIVKSAYRPKQRIEFTTLENMGEADIGMLTTVLIGNSNTFVKHGLMVTPRGYANKYAVEGGNSAARAGEKAGHSLSSGLNGWLTAIHASAKTAAELADEYRLPESYIAAVLSEPLDLDEEVSDDVTE